MSDKPGNGLWGWFGRQVGHVKKAVKTDVTKPAPPTQTPPAQSEPPPQVPQVLYRDEKAQEIKLPDQPGVILRRTVIDEVIVDPEKQNDPPA